MSRDNVEIEMSEIQAINAGRMDVPRQRVVIVR
jgi:hypothetical protein